MKKNKDLSLFTLILLLTSCFTDVIDNVSVKTEKEIPFKIEVLQESREIVLEQTRAWENKTLGYFNIIPEDKVWSMWYNSRGTINKKGDLSQTLNYAYSIDKGKTWIKSFSINDVNIESDTIPNTIFGTGNYDGVVEQFVFKDTLNNQYKLIGAAWDKIDKKLKTFIWASIDKIRWTDKTLLFDAYYDTQFSVILKENEYNIYHRLIINEGTRGVAKTVLDSNMNIVKGPDVIFSNSGNYNFIHVYNSAASYVNDSLTLFFPTLYDHNTDKMFIGVAYETKNDYSMTNIDITQELFYNQNILWGIVSPGLIPTEEPNVYWIYYYGDSRFHNDRATTQGYTRYYRVKIKISKSTSL